MKPNIGPSFRAERLGHFKDQRAWEAFRAAYERAMAGLPAPAETRDVTTSFGVVRAYRFGDGAGPPLVLLPGRTSSSPMWRDNLGGLTADRPVWTVDLLGEPGLSVQRRPLRTADDQAAWLAETTTALAGGPAHLLGVSIGGWSAVNLAIRRPGSVASVSLLDPASVFGRFTWKVVLVSLGAVLPVFPGSWRRGLLGWISGGADVSDDEPVATLIASGMRDFSAYLPAPDYPSDERLAALDVPVLAVIAGRSIIHDAARAAERARRVLRHGTVELWPEASHAINGEQPDRVAAAVTAFVGRYS